MGKGGEWQPGPLFIGLARSGTTFTVGWLNQTAKRSRRPITLDKKTAQIKHGGNLLFAAASLKKRTLLSPPIYRGRRL